MTPLAKLSNNLNLTVNEARKIIGKYGYKSADLTDDIVGYIERQEKGIVQEVFTEKTEPIKPAIDEPVENGVNDQLVGDEDKYEVNDKPVEHGVSYLELVDDESQAMTIFSLAKSFDLDPNNIPKSEIEILKQMVEEAEIVQQANQFLDESEKALVASQFTDFKTKVESTIISSELAAEVVYKAGQTAYNRRFLELKAQEREQYQENQEQLQSGLVHLLKQGNIQYQGDAFVKGEKQFSLNNYQQKAIGGQQHFFGKANRRQLMVQRLK